MEVDLSAVVQAYRERLDAATYENALLTVALRQSQQEVAELRGRPAEQAQTVMPSTVESRA
jgi:hypothetical protein